MKLAAEPACIDLWCAFCDQIDDPQLLNEYRQLLSPDERAKEPRFYFAIHRRRYLITRALVRTVLSQYVGVDPRSWMFAVNQYGRPWVTNAEAVASRITFNISHTDGLIILAISRVRELGVDVENTAARQPSIDIANRFFAADEALALRALPTGLRQQRFFEYWTLKESYIKARGMGLSIPLDDFSFRLTGSADIGIWINPVQQDSPSRWLFWLLRTVPDYLIALCAERLGTRAPQLTLRNVVPLVSQSQLQHQVLRLSPDAAA